MPTPLPDLPHLPTYPYPSNTALPTYPGPGIGGMVIRSLWAMVQGDPVFMRRVNGWLAVIWVAMIPISIITGWINSVTYVAALSLWALVSVRPWATSDRRARLPSDWAKRRLRVKARAEGMCQAIDHEPDCNRAGNECDHIVNNDDHSMANLQWLSGPCHRAKTLREAQRSAGVGATRKRAPARPPGML